MRKKVERMKSAEKSALESALNSALRNLNNEADLFIKNLLTERERLTVARRILIANLILSGHTQMEINQKLSVSPNTYTKIRRWIEKSLPHFEATNELERSNNKKPLANIQRHPKPFTFAALKKKYPMHYLLFNISEELLKKLNSKS